MDTENTIYFRFSRSGVLVVLACMMFVSALAGQTMRVGQNDEIAFETPVKVGQSVLQPGTYRFKHVIESDHHIIVLTPISGANAGHEVRVQCKLESVGAPAKYTELHFAPGKKVKTLHYVLVAGESAKHRF
jgi:hypothetical protein